ncbi:MAG: hypothetical protein NZM16_11165 [Thermoflexus sp.]|uniref:hypothetical protein n=1 Tax=Thermoflexus sp. TaxID=1969742 RepID=UPI0025EFF4D2|nr:hypothetical protein [Thermoflexus sp.]MCS6964591.1 hypothetical protein [Thermoflexus sp.]MDW8184111.1 hypothetical protein [Anaerolineae bacterium]
MTTSRQGTGPWKRRVLASLLAFLILVHLWLYRQHPRPEILWGGIGALLIIGPLLFEGWISPRLWIRIRAALGIVGLTLLTWLSAWPMASPSARGGLVLIYGAGVLGLLYELVSGRPIGQALRRGSEIERK